MKNSTKFLDDLMKNDIQKYLIIDVTDKPTFQDWWRFESECLNEHFGGTLEECKDWWNTWFITENSCNFILIEISIVEGIYNMRYITEAEELEDLEARYSGIPCIMSFKDIYNKYIAEISPESLVEVKQNKNICFLTHEELDQLCGGSSEVNLEPIAKEELDYANKEEIKAQFELIDLKEENELLQDTIKDMEAQINKLNTILEFVWAMLENKIKEDK